MNIKDTVMRNWKTTTVGGVLAASGYVTMFPSGFPENVANMAKFVNVGGLATLGVVAKDSNVSGEDEEIK
jgi:hypothetical protein